MSTAPQASTPPSAPPTPGPVPPGTGWPEDPARPDTPVAHEPEQVRALAASAADIAELEARESVCRACPRLVAWREQVAAVRRRQWADEQYWGRPVPGWGDPQARILIIGLAPAAHGGNRTGRIFTGDRSGDWLFAALHRAGLARLPTSRYAGDGQELIGARILSAVRCAPPDNKPTPAERDACAPWLDRELGLLLGELRAIVALGAFGWTSTLTALTRAGLPVPRPRPKFGHGASVCVGKLLVIGSFHPSQQNTFTGRLTEAMLDDVLARACAHASRPA